MVDISFDIELYCKDDLDILVELLKKEGIARPVSIIELSNCYTIKFNSEYHHAGIEFQLSAIFEEYEFRPQIENGTSEIKLRISMTQSPLSTDNWDRRFNSDPVHSVSYLVKKEKEENVITVNPKFRVLFGSDEREYILNIVPGMNKTTEEKGFMVVKTIGDRNEKPDLLINELFPDRTSAFWRGFHTIEGRIEQDYIEWIERNKRRYKKK